MKINKKLFIIIVLTSIFAFCIPASAQNSVIVNINGKNIDLAGHEPVIQDGRVFCPVRAIGEYIGALVSWIPEDKSVYVYRNGVYVLMKLGSLEYYYGPNDAFKKAEKPMDAAPRIIGGSTMIPLRYLIEAFGGSVNWDSITSTVKINIDPEERGNSVGNHMTGSIVAFSGSSIYYCDNEDLKLYRMDPDVSLTSKFRLSDYMNIANINVLDGWVYYTYENGQGIVKTQTIGEASEVLLKKSNGAKIVEMQVVGDWIYYNLDDNSGIYRIPINGGNPTLIVNKNPTSNSPFCITYDRVYFTDKQRESMCISLIDNSRVFTIGYDFAEYTNVVDGWIYYIDCSTDNLFDRGGTITKVRVGGGDRRYLKDLPKAYTLNVADDWMYFYSNNKEVLYKAKIDGTECTKILEQFDTPSLIFTGDMAVENNWLYFSAFNSMNSTVELYRIRTDNPSADEIEKIGYDITVPPSI